MNVYQYPHERFMEKKALSISQLPKEIREAISAWNIDWKRVTPKTQKNESLHRASIQITEEIEEWLEEIEEDEPAIAPKGKDDAVLARLYTQGKTTVTKTELKQAGYTTGILGVPLKTKNFALKPVKGGYMICRK